MKETRIRDVMQRDVYCARPEMPVTEFVSECVRRRITGAPVVDADDQLVGLLSLSDVATAAVFPRESDDGSVGGLMSTPVHTIEPGDSVKNAIKKLQSNRIHRLVVSYQGRVVGLVSVMDILTLASRSPTMQF